MVKKAILIAFILIVFSGCKGGNEEQLPVEFVWDRVTCELCKMALSDRRYSAQVIDHTGKAYYFDDIGCAVLWLETQPWKQNARVWVNDAKTKEWIEASQANWVYGDPKTPMGFGFAATLQPVENPLDYKSVRLQILSGKTLNRENLVKYLDDSRQPKTKK